MKWSYKTVHFELKKEGLLGGAFLDETEIEEQLNDYGRSGWELISVIEVQDGIIAFFKQLISRGLTISSPVQNDLEPMDAYADAEEGVEPIEPDETVYRVSEVDQQEAAGHEDDAFPEAQAEEPDQEDTVSEDTVYDEPYPEDIDDPPPDYHGGEELEETADDDPAEKSIGAIRIE